MLTLKELLTHLVRDSDVRDTIAYIHNQQPYTYRQIFEQSQGLRNSLGRERDNPVLVCGHKEPGMLAGFLACVAAGRPFVPVDQSLPAERIQQIARITEARHAFVCNRNIPEGALAGMAPANIIDASHPIAADCDDLFENPVAGLDTAYVIFTSGTTGEPKGVQIPAEALEDFVDWTVNALFPAPPRNKTWMNHAILSFDLSVFEIWTSIATAGTVLALDSSSNRNIRAVFRDLQAYGTQIWVSTPSYADLCLMDPRFSNESIPSLEDFIFCGEILSRETARLLKQRFPTARVWNLYGPTEATCATTGLEISNAVLDSCNALPVGKPKPGTSVEIIDDEIIISGANVSTGYINRPELTAEAFSTANGLRSYRTGDLGRFDALGRLFFLGRADSQIKLNGYRIELGEIENAVRGLREVDAAACVDILQDGKVTALGCCYSGTEQAADNLKQALGTTLPPYMVPAHFVHVPALPLNNNGKLDRRKVRELFS